MKRIHPGIANTLIWSVGLLLLLALFAAGVRYLDLLPPEQLTMAAGPEGGGYYDTALAYQHILARDGIRMEIIETDGSVENSALLESPDQRVDIALVQGGIELDDELIEGLGSVFVEPLWVFARPAATTSSNPNNWQGLRIALGATGSGLRPVLNRLHTITGAAALDPAAGGKSAALAGERAARALLAREIDLALFVAPATAPYLSILFASDAVELLALAHNQTLALQLPGASLVEISSGALDYARPWPADNVQLLGMVARLVARKDLHPALTNRLIHAMQEVHGDGTIIAANRRYPSTDNLGLPGNAYAVRLLQDGFSPLEQFLPFWLVAQINRVILLLLPAIFLLFPLTKVLPALYAWVLRGRVFRHYTRVHDIDQILDEEDPLNARHLGRLAAELDDIEHSLRHANLPAAYRKQAYTLIHHIDYVRNRITRRQAPD